MTTTTNGAGVPAGMAEELQASLRGELIAPDHGAYDTARAMTNTLRKATLVGIVLALLGVSDARAEVFTVNLETDIEDIQIGDTPNSCDVSVNPGSQCSLRAALQESNATTGTDVVKFAIPGGGVHSLVFASPLPALIDRVLIDGYTQPGASPNTRKLGKPLDTDLRIELDGTGLALGNGIRVASGGSGSTVKGLAIVNFESTAVLADSGPVNVEGNFLGANPDGQQQPNGTGFFAFANSAEGSVIGGSRPAKRNLISGNAAQAVSSNQAVTVRGNYIGLNGGGGCQCAAVELFESGGANRVVGNVISGNVNAAVATFNGGPNAPTLISRNRMFGNDLVTGIAIDLDGDGITPNDRSEADGLQNFPVISSAKRQSGETRLEGRLRSAPRSDYRIEVFLADGETRQGKRLAGSKTVTTNGRGHARFALRSGLLGRGDFATATATLTGAVGATSEFARPEKVK